MAETEKMLRTVLVMQAEILGRLEAIEQAVGADHRPPKAPRNDALAELIQTMRSGLRTSLTSDLDDLVDAVSGG